MKQLEATKPARINVPIEIKIFCLISVTLSTETRDKIAWPKEKIGWEDNSVRTMLT